MFPFLSARHIRLSVLILAAGLLSCGVITAPSFAQSPGKAWVEKATVASPVAGQKRLALILGNTHYGGTHELQNPENDAKAISVALSKLGFVSTVLLDGSRDEMRDSVNRFAEQIRAAGDSSVALLYYSGHGMQVNGENYLIPIGFKMPAEQSDISDYALSAQKALDKMQSAKAQINIAILDACRDNPFEGSRAMGGRGLAKLETQGMLIAYATAAGRTADDNAQSKNGLYTASLLKYLQTPGLKLYDMFKSTANEVYEASKHQQAPYVYDGLLGVSDFYLLPGNTSVVESANANTLDTNAHLTITTNVPGATILVDDKPLTDSTFTLDLGIAKQKTVEVGIAADGFKSAVQTVTLLRGKTLTLPVTLSALPPTPAPPVSAEVIGATVPKRFKPPLTLAEYKAQMVTVPAGEFTMGMVSDSRYRTPLRKLYLPTYKIGKTTVTVGMWQEFCVATNRKMPDALNVNRDWAKRDHPMVNVSWNDAQEYCTWAKMKLPSEAQWEKAARGTDGRTFPWGNKFNVEKLWCSKEKPYDAGGTRAVGDFPTGASPYGCLDMAGNVYQWCRDICDKNYFGSRRTKETYSVVPFGNEARVLHGGSWTCRGDSLESSFRVFCIPSHKSYDIGFRAVSQ